MSNVKIMTAAELDRYGGGQPPPKREPGLVGRWLRANAETLLNRKQALIEAKNPSDLAAYFSDKKEGEALRAEFARVQTPGLPGILAAAAAIWHFGVCARKP